MKLVFLRPLIHLHAQHLPPFGLLVLVKLVNVIVELAVQIHLPGMPT